jgi:hypothetical protein
MEPNEEGLRERFWKENPWPGEVRLRRLEAYVIPSQGRTGRWLVDEVELSFRTRIERMVVVYAPRLQPAGAAALSARFTRVLRESLSHRLAGEREPSRLVVVEVATPGLLTACRREHLGLLDLGGTIDLNTSDLLVQIAGQRVVQRRARVSPFSAVGAKVIRALLLTLDAPLQTRELARLIHASYSSVWSALEGLENLGLVERRHGTPPRVLDARALVQHWCAHGTPPIREGFFCPSTGADRLSKGLERLHERGGSALFTYRSALHDDELVASGLPHGVRSGTSTSLIVEAFGLRPVTPHNFFILRESAAHDVVEGGVRMSPRLMPAGPAVSVPQLVFDLHHAGDRAAEQAAALLDRWWSALPPRPFND